MGYSIAVIATLLGYFVVVAVTGHKDEILTFLKGMRGLFMSLVRLFAWPFRKGMEMYKKRNQPQMASQVVAAPAASTGTPKRVITKQITDAAQVKYLIFGEAVVPEIHVSCEHLKAKLGGETLQLEAISLPKFDLNALNSILVDSANQVMNLLESLAPPAPKSATPEASRRRDRKNGKQKRDDNRTSPAANPESQTTPDSSPKAAAAENRPNSGGKDTNPVVTGRVYGFGVDKRTLHNPDGPSQIDSFYVDLKLKDGQIARQWGVDLERALRQAQADVGDAVSLAKTGKVGKKNTFRIEVLHKAAA